MIHIVLCILLLFHFMLDGDKYNGLKKVNKYI